MQSERLTNWDAAASERKIRKTLVQAADCQTTREDFKILRCRADDIDDDKDEVNGKNVLGFSQMHSYANELAEQKIFECEQMHFA